MKAEGRVDTLEVNAIATGNARLERLTARHVVGSDRIVEAR